MWGNDTNECFDTAQSSLLEVHTVFCRNCHRNEERTRMAAVSRYEYDLSKLW
jgi:hypothetical protein